MTTIDLDLYKPQMTIVCGISGSGKSTISKEVNADVVCSADDFFMDGDDYNFDPTKLPKAHGECLKNCVNAMAGEFDICIDNTNTTVAEIAPYAALALAYGYALDIVIVECDVNKAHARNTHDVPLVVIEGQADRLKSLSLPPWWPVRRVTSG